MQRVTGIGGVFLRGSDAEALRTWYAEHLGIDINPAYGGSTFARGGGAGSTTWDR